jgi:hypothetical protein
MIYDTLDDYLRAQIQRLKGVQRQLAEAISAVSQKIYFGQLWFCDVEHEAFDVLENISHPYRKELTQAEIDELARLRQEAGGWIYWDSPPLKRYGQHRPAVLRFVDEQEWAVVNEPNHRLELYTVVD